MECIALQPTRMRRVDILQADPRLMALDITAAGMGAADQMALKSFLADTDSVVTVTPLTARKMKEGEVNGEGLIFFDLEEWNALKESGDLLEFTEMMGNDYGTSRKLVLNEFDKGKNVIIQTEPDRAAQIKRNMPEAVCILVYPFDSGILKTRYTEKARSSFEVSVRTEVALKQINSSKLFCDREVDSGDADKACKEIISIINGN